MPPLNAICTLSERWWRAVFLNCASNADLWALIAYLTDAPDARPIPSIWGQDLIILCESGRSVPAACPARASWASELGRDFIDPAAQGKCI